MTGSSIVSLSADILSIFFILTRLYVLLVLLWISCWTILNQLYRNIILVLFVAMFLRDLWVWGKSFVIREIDVIERQVKKLSQCNVVSNAVSNAVNNFVEKTATVIYDSISRILFSPKTEPIQVEKPDRVRIYINNMKLFPGSFFTFQCLVFSSLLSLQTNYFQIEYTCKNVTLPFLLSTIISFLGGYIVDVLVRNNFFIRLIIILIKCWNHENSCHRLHIMINIATTATFFVKSLSPALVRIFNQPQIDSLSVTQCVIYFLATTIMVILEYFYKNKFIKVQQVKKLEKYLMDPSTGISLEGRRIVVVLFAVIISLSDILTNFKSTFLIAIAYYFVGLYTFRSIYHRTNKNQIFSCIRWITIWLNHWLNKDPNFNWIDCVETLFIAVDQLFVFCRAAYEAEGEPIDVQITNIGLAIQGQKNNIKQSTIIVICAIERLIELTKIPDNLSLVVQRKIQIIKVISKSGTESDPTPADIMELNKSPILSSCDQPDQSDQCIKIVKNSRYVDPEIANKETAPTLWNYGKSFCDVFAGTKSESIPETVQDPTITFSIKKQIISDKASSLIEYTVPGINGLMEYKTVLEVACTVDNICNDEILSNIFALVKKNILLNHRNDDILKNVIN